MGGEKRVVITGMAPVCALGKNKDEFFENLYNDKIFLKSIDSDVKQSKKIKSKFVVPYPELELSEYTEKIKAHKNYMSKNAYTSCIASYMALKDAGIENVDEDMAVIIGMGTCNIGNLNGNIKSYHNNSGRFEYMAIPTIMPNSTASWISILHHCHGPSYVLNLACASATSAIGHAYMGIKNGRFNTAFCGGTECFADDEYIILKAFEYLHTLTTNEDGIPRVFSEERSGFLFNEGASCILILEELESALQRNARIYAEITGYEELNEAYNIVTMDTNGVEMEKLIRKTIGNEKVDYYNAHGTGTKLNDFVEGNVIQKIFGNNQPYINSTKGYMGHSIGASGAFEVCVCADSIFNNRLHGNLLGTPMNDLNLTKKPVTAVINTAVSTSFGFGGHNTALVMKKYVENM